MSKSIWIRAAVVLMVVCAGAAAEAAQWATLGSQRRVDTIILTGNFKSPRLMAELIMFESRQPHILLPNRPDDNLVIVRLTKENCFQIKEEKLGYFISYLNPKRVVILGDERYVSRRYEDMIDDAIPVVRIHGKDWNRVADELKFMLNLSNLAKEFSRLNQQEEKAYLLTSTPAPTKSEEKPAEQPAELQPMPAAEK